MGPGPTCTLWALASLARENARTRVSGIPGPRRHGWGVSGATVQGQDLALRLAWEAWVKGAGGARGLGEEEPPLKRAGERVRCAGEVSKGVGCGIGTVQQQAGTCRVLAGAGSFFFFIFKKIQKYMSVLKNFENAPRSLGLGATGVLSPKQRATGPQYNFFLNLQRGPWPGVCGGRGVLSPPHPPHGRQGV